jgi:hypothetical protein
VPLTQVVPVWQVAFAQQGWFREPQDWQVPLLQIAPLWQALFAQHG